MTSIQIQNSISKRVELTMTLLESRQEREPVSLVFDFMLPRCREFANRPVRSTTPFEPRFGVSPDEILTLLLLVRR